jgi:hypothetical protein
MDARSKFFEQFDASSLAKTDFLDDFRKLLALDTAARKSFMDALPELLTSPDEGTLTSMIGAIASQLQLPVGRIYDCLGSARFLVNFIIGSGGAADEAELWAQDFIKEGLFSQTDHSALAVVLKRLQEIAAQIQPERRREEAATGVLPVLDSIGTTVELRAVLGTRFRVGATSLSDYEPSITGTLGIASIRLTVDTGDDFSFQVDEHALKALIESLEATRRELDVFVRSSQLVDNDKG